MSRASRKMMKQRRRREGAVANARPKVPGLTTEEKQELQELFEAEQYADYINKLAEAVQAGHYDAEALYRGSYSYFMLGDYVRAAGMVNDVLTLEPGNLKARILLARICILDDRTDDGLAIFDFVIEHYEAQLSTEQKEDIEDMLDYYASTEAKHIRDDFPHIASFLMAAGLMPESDTAEVDAEPGTVAEIPIKETGTDEAAESMAKPGDVPASDESEPDAAADVPKGEIEQIMGQPVSLAEKVKLLNAFAAVHFVAGQAEYDAAQTELEQALQIDTASADTLRNLAVLAKCQGQSDKALKFAAKLPTSDFLLLAYLTK